MNDKKIAVIGIGGVGGYMAALLAKSYPHVSLVARGKRKESIEKNGLTLHSEYRGEHTVRPERVVESAEELPPQDYIFVCVKNYSLEEVCRTMKSCIIEDTVIVPVMNGADPGEKARSFLPVGTVVDSLIYIVAYANEDYSITQEGDFANLHVGIQNAEGSDWKKVLSVNELLNQAGIDCEADKDIQAEIWKKYILNCAYNVTTAYYNNTIGQLRRDPIKAKEYEDLVKEALALAVAKGVHVNQENADDIIHRFYYGHADNATSSLQRDVNAGRQTELETFSGYVVSEAARLSVSVPVSARMYEGLKKNCK